MIPQFHLRPQDAKFSVRLDIAEAIPDFVLCDDGKEAGGYRSLAANRDTGHGDADVVVILTDANGGRYAGQIKVVGGSEVVSGFVDFHGFVFGRY